MKVSVVPRSDTGTCPSQRQPGAPAEIFSGGRASDVSITVSTESNKTFQLQPGFC